MAGENHPLAGTRQFVKPAKAPFFMEGAFRYLYDSVFQPLEVEEEEGKFVRVPAEIMYMTIAKQFAQQRSEMYLWDIETRARWYAIAQMMFKAQSKSSGDIGGALGQLLGGR